MNRLRLYLILVMAFGALVMALALRPVHAASGQAGKPATAVASGYDYDAQSVGFRLGQSGTDTLTTAGILATPEILVLGKANLSIGARFSNSAATVTVQVALVYKANPSLGSSATSTTNNFIKGWTKTITLTASTVQKEGSYYEAPDFVVDTGGAIAARVLVTTATSAGTVDLWIGTF